MFDAEGEIKINCWSRKRRKEKESFCPTIWDFPNTLSTILKNKDNLLEKQGSYDSNSERKRLTTCVNIGVDEAMLKWVTTARAKNLPLSGVLIREKALDYAAALGHEDFSASVGWLDKF